MKKCLLALLFVCVIAGAVPWLGLAQEKPAAAELRQYLILATNKTSTMEKELNEGAAQGYRFEAVMGGETAFGGSETVTLMSRAKGAELKGRYQYKLLATTLTSTMQKEMQAAASTGYMYRGQTVYKSTFGGQEIVIIMERDQEAPKGLHYAYQLVATKRTATMQKEVQQAAEEGFVFAGVTVAKTGMAGTEIVTIMQRTVR